ncbi:hypothetical protein [Candidatus Electronema sp. PJ]|uniref:hypothetical protein n=1 Tax=Candidatus Electronema sp. PJ TaxID=3401572 RepID=UPI003AA7AFF1
MYWKTNHFFLVGHVSCSLTKEFGSVRKELYSATEEFCLAELLSYSAKLLSC